MRIIGDVHGKQNEYTKIAEASPDGKSICVGDVGFNYKYINENLDSKNHVIVGGNHDNYNSLSDHFLGDYGTKWGISYIRGAYSIDKRYRTENIDWFRDEELNPYVASSAKEYIVDKKPPIMITHSCPIKIARLIGNPAILRGFGLDPDVFSTATQNLLQSCFDQHKPQLHIFGHFHMNLDFMHKGTRFICLDELCYLDIDVHNDEYEITRLHF